MDETILYALLLGGMIICAIFFICRELVCWYWKMNETVTLLSEIRDLLKQNLQTTSTIKPKALPDPEFKPTKTGDVPA